MKTYAVIGAGTMGSGIAQKIAIEGSRVIVVDINQQALDRGKDMMNTIFKESSQRKLLSEEQVNNTWKSIIFTTDFEECQNADFIIEAVFEDRKVKEEIFSKLENIVRADAVIASNTSSFRITELAKTLRRPERFVGLHFFYHPVKNRLLEIIPGEKTNPQTLEAAQRFCALLGKVDIVCKDSPGFVVNRFFVPWLNESVRILAEGKATLNEIEITAKKCFNLGMGPFELMNVTGVPIAVHASEGLAQALGDFYRPDPLLITQAQKGLWPMEKSAAETGQTNDYVYHRLLGLIVAIAATLVEEGAAAPLDIDLGARVGLRWPEGPLSLYNRMIQAERQQVIDTFKERYRPGDFTFPQGLTADVTFPLSNVVETAAPGNIATLSLARPDHANAFNEAMFKDLDSAVARNSGASVLIINGKGKNFAAGADIDLFIRNIEDGRIDRTVDFTRDAQATLAKIDRFAGSVIAVVDGFALGGGAELMLAADVITASPRALIGFPETGIGIYPGLGGTYRLTRKVGEGLAKYLIGTGQLLNGKDAAAIGLVDSCLAPEDMTVQWLVSQVPVTNAENAGNAGKRELPAKWQNIAAFMNQHSLQELLEKTFSEEWQIKIQAKLRSKAPIALGLAMELIQRAATCEYDEFAAIELAHLEEIFSTEDALTGLKSVGKYRPVFKGK